MTHLKASESNRQLNPLEPAFTANDSYKKVQILLK